MNQFNVRAYEGNEPFIFVSYAHKDSAQVLSVIAQLQNRGYRIWYDEGIVPGSEWTENIALHLNNCAAVIAFLSPNSVNSSNCRREITYALSKNKPFLGIFLTETSMSPGMEMQISSQQCVMKYLYRDASLFYEKVCAFPGLRACKKVQPVEHKSPEPTPVQRFVYSQPAVRKLTIRRGNTIVASAMTLKVYIEDSVAGDLTINGTRCRKLGTINNGETKAFMISTAAAKVYVIADKIVDMIGRNLINEFYPLPAGMVDVELSGQCRFNPMAGNPFRFDGVQDENVLRNRKRGARWGWVIAAIVAVFSIVGALVNGGLFETKSQVASRIFAGEGYKITLTEDFKNTTYEGYDAAYESEEVLVIIISESFELVPELKNYSSYDYAEYILRMNGKNCEVKEYSDYLYFEYVSTSKVSGEDLHYFISIHKGPDAYWMAQFVTDEENAGAYRESIFRWADTFAANR